MKEYEFLKVFNIDGSNYYRDVIVYRSDMRTTETWIAKTLDEGRYHYVMGHTKQEVVSEMNSSIIAEYEDIEISKLYEKYLKEGKESETKN
jgi:hypothetical protein